MDSIAFTPTYNLKSSNPISKMGKKYLQSIHQLSALYCVTKSQRIDAELLKNEMYSTLIYPILFTVTTDTDIFHRVVASQNVLTKLIKNTEQGDMFLSLPPWVNDLEDQSDAEIHGTTIFTQIEGKNIVFSHPEAVVGLADFGIQLTKGCNSKYWALPISLKKDFTIPLSIGETVAAFTEAEHQQFIKIYQQTLQGNIYVGNLIHNAAPSTLKYSLFSIKEIGLFLGYINYILLYSSSYPTLGAELHNALLDSKSTSDQINNLFDQVNKRKSWISSIASYPTIKTNIIQIQNIAKQVSIASLSYSACIGPVSLPENSMQTKEKKDIKYNIQFRILDKNRLRVQCKKTGGYASEASYIFDLSSSSILLQAKNLSDFKERDVQLLIQEKQLQHLSYEKSSFYKGSDQYYCKGIYDPAKGLLVSINGTKTLIAKATELQF